MKKLWFQCLPLFADVMTHDRPVLNSNINDLVWLISVSFGMTIHWIWHSSCQAQLTPSHQSYRLGTQYTIKHMLRHSYECCVYICLSPAKSLRLVTAYTSYDAADKIIRRLTAYEVCGGLWQRLGALTIARCTLQCTRAGIRQQLHAPHCYVPGPLSHLL